MGVLPRFTAVLAAAAAALSLCAAAGAGLKVGVADDTPKGDDDGGAAMLSTLTGVGMSVVRLSVWWDDTQPATITEYAALNRAINAANAKGVQIVLIVSPLRPDGVTSTHGNARLAAFCVRRGFVPMRSGDRVYREQQPAAFRSNVRFMRFAAALLYAMNVLVAFVVLSRPR